MAKRKPSVDLVEGAHYAIAWGNPENQVHEYVFLGEWPIWRETGWWFADPAEYDDDLTPGENRDRLGGYGNDDNPSGMNIEYSQVVCRWEEYPAWLERRQARRAAGQKGAATRAERKAADDKARWKAQQEAAELKKTTTWGGQLGLRLRPWKELPHHADLNVAEPQELRPGQTFIFINLSLVLNRKEDAERLTDLLEEFLASLPEDH